MSERNTCCAVSPLRPVSGLLRPHRRSPRMASTISSCSSRKSAIAASDGSRTTPCRNNSQSAKLNCELASLDMLSPSIVPPSSAARASKPSRTALRPRTTVLEGRARCPNSAELPAPVLRECKPKTGVPCDDRTTRNSGAAHQIGKAGNSPECTGSDAGSASPEWPAIGPLTDPPTSALHPQVIRSCALACVSKTTLTFNQKSTAKIESVENPKNAGSTGISLDLRQKLASFCRETLFCCTGPRFSRGNGGWF